MATRFGATLRPEQLPTLATTLQALGETDAMLSALRDNKHGVGGYEIDGLSGIELSHAELLDVFDRRRARLLEELSRMNITVDTTPLPAPVGPVAPSPVE